MRYVVALLLLSGVGVCQKAPTFNGCKLTFAVARIDDLGNTLPNFRQETAEWFQKKIAVKYPEICYTEKDSDVVMVFSSRPAVYRGVRRVSNSNTTESPIHGTVTDRDVSSSSYGEKVGTIDGTVETTTTTESAVPYNVDYELLYLTIQLKVVDKWKPVETFRGRTLHPTALGLICTRNCHPNQHNIEDAVKWLRQSAWDNSSAPVIH